MKSIKIRLTAIAILSLISTICNAQSSQKECNCSPQIVPPEQVSIYTSNYSEIFIGSKNKKHTKEVFLSREYAEFFYAYFTKNPADTGVWILFSSLKQLMDANQQSHRHQILIQLIAADQNKKLKYKDGFKKFMEENTFLKNPEKNKFLVNWGEGFNSSSTFGPEKIISMTDTVSETWWKNYSKRYRFLNQRHSKALFICKETFIALWQFIESDPLYDGIIFSFASYRDKIDCTGQVRKKQITLIISPSKNKMPDYNKYHDVLFSKKYTTSYNHGELCPKKCPN